ncbi:MAG: putative quinol monooxygenase [Alphaproteobacteria bacterium]|nr:putative quinol monooxygenase [Alphaproteobacteria bacterium]
MYAVCVTFRIKPGEAGRFMPLIEENARQSLETEDGCRRFDVCTDESRPDEVFLYELYDDAGAFARHKETAHFAEFDAAVTDMVAEKTVTTYARVS